MSPIEPCMDEIEYGGSPRQMNPPEALWSHPALKVASNLAFRGCAVELRRGWFDTNENIGLARFCHCVTQIVAWRWQRALSLFRQQEKDIAWPVEAQTDVWLSL